MSNKPQKNWKRQTAESFVFVNEEWQKLSFDPVRSLVLRSGTLPTDDGCTVYTEGEDYVVDKAGGAVRRTPGSRIPNWAEHAMCGLSTFDHSRFADYSNKRFTVFGDYDYQERSGANGSAGNEPYDCGVRLARTIGKLSRGERIRYVVFGDSISCGGEASRDALAYYNLFAEALRALFPAAEIEVVNRAVGGEGSTGALARLDNDVIALRPDLVSIGYGMNDQCRGESIRNGIPPREFEENIRRMVGAIEAGRTADTILITPCLSNPAWVHSSGDLAIYADILKRIGRELDVGVADVHELWQRELRAGKSHASLLLNNINHPNDYGHRIYFQAFRPFLTT
ncbi:SGNH/GDSL hydrolase family protein [Paenibacillus sp. MBLB4367]|uniref:SGNH/GDSL hydrolase family protein n=1 Tax=Paenibacillus sp. MBLB4367 TaxID=3384767 RepID=UPI003908151A